MASLYLQYRPQRVKDLDLKTVREFFERILLSGKVNHAYLFTGPKGGGKTSAARILAKIVNCTKNEAVMLGKRKKFEEPCNKCVACKSIASGSMVDLIEIDAASNRGIDDIRDLREKIRLAPVAAARKVYIIDEVHMLTLEAFNALLKTLEEPPLHAVFILATTEAHKVPETIVSRCVRVVFPKASREEIRRSLDRVVKGEKLKVASDALDMLSGSVDGSFREAVKILEQTSLSGKKVTVEKVREELGRSEGLSGEKLLGFLAQEETRAALAEIDRLENLGVNWTVVVAQMIETTRQQLMVVLGVEPQEKRVTALGSLDERTLWLLVDALLLAARRIRSSDIAQLPLEMMVVRWGEGKKHEARDTNYEGTRGTRSMESTEGMESIGGEGRTGSASRTSREDIEEISMPPPRSRSVAVSRGFEIAEVEKRWHEVLSAVRPHNHSVEGLLRSTRPAAVKGETLVIEVFYQFHLDQLKQERFMQIVEGALQEVFSHRWRLQYRLGERAHRPIRQVFDREAQTESAQDVPPIRQAQDVPPTRENTLENISAEVTDEDVVKVAEEVFGAE